MSATKTVSQSLGPWLKANLGNKCLAPLTSQDAKALMAAVQIIDLYAYHRTDEVLQAFKLTVECMQPKTRELAYHAIAHVMEWDDRLLVWAGAGLDLLPLVSICVWEPEGRRRQAVEGGKA